MLEKKNTRSPRNWDKEATKLKSAKLNAELAELQNVLYAENKWKVLVILQGMDASGKDGVVKNVFRGVNPLGIRVKSFKAPTEEEKAYNFLWRIQKEIPRTGMIQVFNRSYYEDILVPAVHKTVPEKILKNRYDQINSFEHLLTDDHTLILKFYLHINRKEQAERLKERMELPEKKWKYDPSDLRESKLWNQYMAEYEKIFSQCSKKSPWHIIPAGQNWYRDYVILEKIVSGLKELRMKYPKVKIS